MLYAWRFVQHQYTFIVLAFGGRLDEHRLKAAIRLAMDAEPVFGCRYVPGRKPYWERRADLDSLDLCTVARTADFEGELNRFVAAPRDGTRDPLFDAHIVRGRTDTLLVRISHLAADGMGSKELVSLAAYFYRNPGRAEAVSPNLASRGPWQLFRQSGWLKCLPCLLKKPRLRAKPEWCFPVDFPHKRGVLRVAARQLDPAVFDALHAFGKRLGATMNDVFVAAYFRALWRFFDFPPGIPQSILIPTSARRYLPSGRTGAICNFVVPLHATMERIAGEVLEQTVIRVRNSPLREPARRERVVAGMFWIAVLYSLFRKPIEGALEAGLSRPPGNTRTVATLTNLGSFDPDQFDFGVPTTDIYKISQANFAPGILMNVSSFRKRLTFAINYPSRAIRPADIERLLDLFVEELAQASAATLSPATPETGHPALHLPSTK